MQSGPGKTGAPAPRRDRDGAHVTSARLVFGLALLVLVLALTSGYWLWGRLKDLEPARPTVPVPTATAIETVTPTPTVLKAPPGYRLAGVAVGEPESFAVVETAAGTSNLYRVGDEVPGLGRLTHIEAERVVLQGDAGQFDLWLTPAATATPGRSLVTVTPRSTPRTPAPPTGRRRAARGAGTAPGSTP